MAVLSNYLRQGAGNFVDALGTAFVKPITGKDFGISERIAGGPTTNTYGAQAYSPAPAQSTPQWSPAPQYSSFGSVLGSATNTPSSSSGGGTRTSSPAPTPTQNPYENIQPSGPSQGEIDSQFNPVLGVLNEAEGNLRGQLPGLIGEAEAQAQASRQLLGNQRLVANELLGQQEQSTQAQQQRMMAQQRQTLQEMQLANQQRFGGASSAGLGASEIQGREFQRSQYGIQENAQQALQQIGQQRQVVEREYNQGLQQLEVNRQQAVNEIQRKFQDRMLEINARRGEAESAKAQARMQAVQELRNQAYQINVAKAQFEADLRSQAQADTQYLSQVEQQYLGAGQAGQEAYGQFAGMTPSAIPGVQGGAQQDVSALSGQISRKPEDAIGQVGSIPGSSMNDPRFQNFQPIASSF